MTRFPDRSYRKAGFSPTEKGDYSGTQRGPRQIKVLRCINMSQGKISASALGNTSPYSKMKYAIKAYAVQNVEASYDSRNIYIL
jgi:hypothetical protein